MNPVDDFLEGFKEQEQLCSLCRGTGYVDRMVGEQVESADCPRCIPSPQVPPNVADK